MVWFLWVCGLAYGGGELELSWRDDTGRLELIAPVGEHIAEDAPLDVRVDSGLRTWTLASFGRDAVGGLSVPVDRGEEWSADVAVSLCQDGGTACRMVRWAAGTRVPVRRKGSLRIVPGDAPVADTAQDEPSVDPDAALAEAQRRAKEAGRPVLIGFRAVWCPPCNQLGAELLEAADRPAVLDAFEVVDIDADHRASWNLKDRFDVGGYPTLVALGPDGGTLGSLIGYPGRDEALSWFERMNDRVGSSERGVDSWVAAWDEIAGGREDAARVFLASQGDPGDSVEGRLVRMRLQPSLADAQWLAEHAPSTAVRWVLYLDDAWMSDPGALPAVTRAVTRALPAVSSYEAGDLLGFLATHSDADTASVLFAAAAAALEAGLTGDAALDKPHLTWLAYLYDKADRPDRAAEVLEAARARFALEPTFHLALAKLWLRRDRASDALVPADAAMAVSWDDNRLKSAATRTQVLLALGRDEDAQRFVDAVLAELPAPEDGVNVRAHRMREALQAMVAR